MKPRRGSGFAAVCASAVPAGIMASSSGSAMAAPAPCSTVLRERCFFVMYMACPLNPSYWPVLLDHGGLQRRRLLLHGNPGLGELVAQHQVGHQRGEAVIVGRRTAHDVAHEGHVM